MTGQRNALEDSQASHGQTNKRRNQRCCAGLVRRQPGTNAHRCNRQPCTRPADFCIRFFGICIDDPIPYVGNQSDCDDSSALARPGGGPEACDGYDNDCNGTRDDGLARPVTIYRDGDGDGRGVSPAILVCREPIGQESDWVQVCCDSDDDDASTF